MSKKHKHISATKTTEQKAVQQSQQPQKLTPQKLNQLLEKNPFAQLLGMELLEVREGYAYGRMRMDENFTNIYGGMHGGCAYALADTLAGLAASTYGNYVTTIDGKMNYLGGQLIQNSIKYAREDGAKIVFSGALLDEGLASERIELTVADNGCGVNAADLPRVFEKGFTGDNGRATKRATGIGLYLVARLCSKMGIDVTAASEPGEGFVVTFAFSTNKFQYFE